MAKPYPPPNTDGALPKYKGRGAYLADNDASQTQCGVRMRDQYEIAEDANDRQLQWPRMVRVLRPKAGTAPAPGVQV